MKAKIDRFLLGILLILSLLVSSCNDLFGGDSDDEDEWTIPTITVSVSNENARTAFPEMNVNKITEFTLTGTNSETSAPIPSINETWTSEGSSTAYSKMKEARLPISVGTWTFTLTAKAKNASVTLATYEKTLSGVVISSGANKLSFELILQEVNVANEAGAGNLEIAITLQETAISQVQAITGTLLKNETGRPSAGKGVSDLNMTNTSAIKYEVSSVDAGVYIAQIDFYADTAKQVLLGTWLEAVNINELGAKASIKVGNLDNVFNITYKAAVLGSDEFSDSGFTHSNQTKYTRRNNITFSAPTKDGYTFIKWVDHSSTTSSGTTLNGDSFIGMSGTTGLNKSVGDYLRCIHFQ